MRLPPGVRDWLPDELARKRAIEERIREVSQRWLYAEVQTPSFELTEVLQRGLGASGVGHTFRFTDLRGDSLALRAEMTTPIARVVSARMRHVPLPLRLSYIAPAFRYEEPQLGRMREFTQAGAELIGASGPEADAETLFMAIETLDAVGIPDARFDINDTAIVDGVLAAIEISGEIANECKQLISERNLVELRAFGDRNAIEKGAFDTLLQLTMMRGGEDVFAIARPICKTAESKAALSRLEKILKLATIRGYRERITIDFALLRDFAYYTGFVFEGYVDDLGVSLCGGGRYDSLLPRFGYDVPAVGWMVSVERILLALERRDCHPGRTEMTSPTAHRRTELTIAIPKGNLYDEAAQHLRAAGVNVPSDVGRKLTVETEDGKYTLLLLRPTDVPAYVEFGAADCGIVGKDILWETDRSVSELADLQFGACRLVVAARRTDGYHEGQHYPTFLRVATKFKKSAETYFAERDLPCEIIGLHGSVEIAPIVALADVIVDLVATGNTLRAHDMVVVDEIAPSTARFVVNPVHFRAKYTSIRYLLERLVQIVLDSPPGACGITGAIMKRFSTVGHPHHHGPAGLVH